MSQDAEPVRIDLTAIGNITDDAKAGFISMAFHDAPDEEKQLLPIIVRMHDAWGNAEAERILAFFVRDNPDLPMDACMRRFLGLNTLEWAASMTEDAIKNDDFAKMMVMWFAGENLGQPDVGTAFKESLEAGRYSHLILLGLYESEALAEGLGEEWGDAFAKLTSSGPGQPYLAGQVLIGAMLAEDKEAFAAGLPKAVDGHAGGSSKHEPDEIRDYLTAMASAFSPEVAGPQVFQNLVEPAWEEY